MAAESKSRSPEQVKQEIARERAQLAEAVDELRSELGVSAKLRSKLPMLAGGALAGGFVLAGGIGATMRLLARRSREGKRKAKVGRFSLVDR